MIAVETLYSSDGKPVGRMRCDIERASFRFEPIDDRDSRFDAIKGRRFGDPERLRARVKDACETSDG